MRVTRSAETGPLLAFAGLPNSQQPLVSILHPLAIRGSCVCSQEKSLEGDTRSNANDANSTSRTEPCVLSTSGPWSTGGKSNTIASLHQKEAKSRSEKARHLIGVHYDSPASHAQVIPSKLDRLLALSPPGLHNNPRLLPSTVS
jgi:hypothetical protein